MLYRIERLLLSMGARPDRRGYEQTVLALSIMMEYPEEYSVQNIYRMTAKRCGLSPAKIEDGVRETIRCIWKHQREIDDLPLKVDKLMHLQYEPSNKEFLFTIATQLRLSGLGE